MPRDVAGLVMRKVRKPVGAGERRRGNPVLAFCQTRSTKFVPFRANDPEKIAFARDFRDFASQAWQPALLEGHRRVARFVTTSHRSFNAHCCTSSRYVQVRTQHRATNRVTLEVGRTFNT